MKIDLGNGKFCYTVNCKKHFNMYSGGIVAASTVVDRSDPEWGEYYAGTERKHFSDPKKPGSKFTDPNIKSLNDVVALAYVQRGGLGGDDREKLLMLGAEPDAFKDNFRYLIVYTPGTLGFIKSSTLRDDTVLKVERTKPGAPCSYVLNVREQPKVNFGVIILSDDFETGKTRLITAFPGQPTYVSLKDSKTGESLTDTLEGQSLTVKQVHELTGRDVSVNTRLIKADE